MTPTAAHRRTLRDPKSWPSRVEASTLLLSLEALARWREHLALAVEDARPEPLLYFETADGRAVDAGYTDAPRGR